MIVHAIEYETQLSFEDVVKYIQTLTANNIGEFIQAYYLTVSSDKDALCVKILEVF
jgi:hypothetical protein